MRPECYFCHIKTIEKLINKFSPKGIVAEDFIFHIHELIRNKKDLSNPNLARDIHSVARDMLNQNDLYAAEKENANSLLLKNYDHWKQRVSKSENPFKTAAKLAVIGNIIDYAAHSVEEDLEKQIDLLYQDQLAIDQTHELKEQINKSSSILYLGDNAGEIVFDRLFIEVMDHPRLTYVVKGKPVINDVTLEDAQITGITEICDVIDNGYDAPSTLLDKCSNEFKNRYNDADLIISKGQGNFEGLINSDHPNLFFLLMAKCRPMAEMLGVRKGDLLVKRNHPENS